MPWPYYLINTRDCFTHHLVPLSTTLTRGGRTYRRTEYFFRCAPGWAGLRCAGLGWAGLGARL